MKTVFINCSPKKRFCASAYFLFLQRLFVNGKKQETQSGRHIFTFTVTLGSDTTRVRVTSGEWSDEASFRHVDKPNPTYSLKDTGEKGANWTK